MEVGNGLGGRLVDGAAEDGVNNAASILDGNALAGTVPAGIHQVGLSTAHLHTLDQLLGVLGGVQLQEGLTEAGGEGGGGLGDAALGATKSRRDASKKQKFFK